ncbi:sensor histidine kinase YesM [Wenyingzhuangia heitensis]|uniref:Sensor histidine kinase YesM n=1 Tax=Wenyingzhuangia heitensis TaxID=1487859 RepID=A0ABX0U8T5_9FLAO|nr:histidine kinase [Wenyingzhuangia heitensis]NIJ45262.1 sensor histidine kinase YesM [Wenyingzhuangia heitensis]
MQAKINYLQIIKELSFQLTLAGLVFILYSYGRHDRIITLQEFIFFSNQSLGAYVIGFVFLPRFFYKNKNWHFAIYSAVVLGIVVFVEEGILERIYFPYTKGRNITAKIFDLLDILPTILILLGAKFAWDAITERKRTKQLELLAKESELQFLKTQINPHFLFNNLNNLYALAIEQSSKTPDFILGLSDMLRYMLYDCKTQYVALTKEVEHLENFIKLNELQIEGRGEVFFTTSKNLQSFNIAPLLFMVFVENAFKHSSSSLTDNIEIKIDLTVANNGVLVFTCTNNYLPKSNTQNLSKGIGLINVKKRLEMLYPNSHSLEIKANKHSYNVFLKLELN